MALTRDDIGVWLINLPRAVERRRKMDAQLQKMDLSYAVFDGVDGKAREDELRALMDLPAFERNLGRKVLWGGIGCYASHLGVWKEFLASGKPAALILEDDVVFHDDFLSAVDLALANDHAWDMLKLNKIRAKGPITQGKLGDYRVNAYLGPATGTGAYLITRATVEKLLPAMVPITRATDHEINRFFRHDFRLFGLEPFPSHVDDGGVSFITGTASGDVVKFKWYKRLPHYWLRASNYFRRAGWLLKKGYLFPKAKRDLSRRS
ncbi:glycosyltransferase family 25 protein [Pseudorhodobacter aquimaris]|uniref:glycosyltransferase family 25 protein n=1 Tax=Pseudorhodobacter aquimaris TaxID=687412 RepID=UPI00067A7C93|nr:glycosyltransferase family 25 protein [Pseudorhodobacter aquimaris]